MARTFTSASSEYIGLTPRAWPAWNGLTIACLLRRNAQGVFHTLYSAGPTSGFSGDLTLGINSSDRPYLEIAGTSRNLATTLTASTFFLAVTKSTGLTTPMAHISFAPFTSWTHSFMSSTLNNPGTAASTAEAIGRWTPSSGDYFGGDMEWLGVWGFAMSSNEIEAMVRMVPAQLAQTYPDTRRFYWFNQNPSDTVQCLANSGADQNARTGTTITAFNPLMPALNTRRPPSQSPTGTPATVAPSAVSPTLSIPTPTIIVGATVAPAAVAPTLTVPAPTIQVDVALTVATVQPALSLPVPATPADLTLTTATVQPALTIPTPSIVLPSAATPDAITPTLTIPAPVIGAGVTLTTSPVALTLTVPSVDVSAGIEVDPSTIALFVMIGQATILAVDTEVPVPVVNVPLDVPLTGVSADVMISLARIAMPLSIYRPDVVANVAPSSGIQPIHRYVRPGIRAFTPL